jgi:hypothetical protein
LIPDVQTPRSVRTRASFVVNGRKVYCTYSPPTLSPSKQTNKPKDGVGWLVGLVGYPAAIIGHHHVQWHPAVCLPVSATMTPETFVGVHSFIHLLISSHVPSRQAGIQTVRSVGGRFARFPFSLYLPAPPSGCTCLCASLPVLCLAGWLAGWPLPSLIPLRFGGVAAAASATAFAPILVCSSWSGVGVAVWW